MAEEGSPILPKHVMTEQFIEAPTTQTVLESRQVGKFLKGVTTPDIHDVERWRAMNTVSLLITNFKNGQEGQHLYILGDGQTTLQHGTNIFMSGAVDLLLAANRVYHFVAYGPIPLKWYQVS